MRTAGGAEGWIDGRLLLAARDLEALRRLRERAAAAPSQGRASVLDELNVHTAPHRSAPSFRRIRPGQHAEVIAYERVPRRPYEPPPLIQNGAAKKGGEASGRKRQRRESAATLAPVPAPPLPENWLALSRPSIAGAAAAPAPRPAAGSPEGSRAEAADEWALVRLEDGSAGWVLARMLFMEIPDEVAQYAERARIAAYFQIGSVRGRDGDKPVWLWATQSKRDAGTDFDSLRIFVWNARRHRYETAFLERNMQGWLPIRVRRGRTGAEGFEAVTLERGGDVVLRAYSIQPGTFRARLVGRTPAARPASWLEPPPAGAPPAAQEQPQQDTWLTRLRSWAGGLRDRFSR